MNDQTMQQLRVALHSKSILAGAVTGVETLSGRCLLVVDYEGARIVLPVDGAAAEWRLLGSEISFSITAVDPETQIVIGMMQIPARRASRPAGSPGQDQLAPSVHDEV